LGESIGAGHSQVGAMGEEERAGVGVVKLNDHCRTVLP
jgi:hypothetical protein